MQNKFSFCVPQLSMSMSPGRCENMRPKSTFRGGRKGTSRVKVRVHLPDKGAVIYCVLCELVLWAVRRLAKCVHWLVAS